MERVERAEKRERVERAEKKERVEERMGGKGGRRGVGRTSEAIPKT